MSTNGKTKLVQRHGNIVAISLYSIAAVMFLIIFGISSAFGQNTYSDSWADTSNPNAILINGCGVTDGSYTHNYYVDVVLKSPSGRTNSRSSSRRNVGYTRADILLPLDANDTGDYFTNTDHWARCPGDDLNFYSIGATVASLLVEYKKSAYVLTNDTDTGGQFGYGYCRYEYTCNNYCLVNVIAPPKLYAGSCPGKWLQCETLVVGGYCVNDARVCNQKTDGPGVCDPPN